MHVTDARPADLMTAAQIQAEWGVPEATVRKWASRGRIIRYPGRRRSERTMYARQHVAPLAAAWRPTPQRAPRAA